MLKKLAPQSLKNLYHQVQALLAITKYGRPAQGLTIIGVTGTDGKTTTSTLIYHLLKTAGKKVALISTVAAYIGEKKIDTGFHVTSPEPWQLQGLIKQVKDKGFDFLVLEATSHGLDQHRLDGVEFTIGVLTNITHEHLDYHKTYTNYVKAKAKLFQKSQVAILNKLDKSFKIVKQYIPDDVKILTYTFESLSSEFKDVVRATFPQVYNQANAAAAITVARYLNIDGEVINKGIGSFPGVPGRMQVISTKNGVRAIVDFAHTPNALEQALLALKATTKGKLIAIFGSAGLRDVSKRPMMAKVGAELADYVILTAEDPRTEDIWHILDQMMVGVSQNHGHIFKIPDRQAAINFGLSLAKPGDTVGVFGKGHEQSMCYGTTEHPWSDEEGIKKALKLL